MIYFNGINGDTGNYLFDPLSMAGAAALARGNAFRDDDAAKSWIVKFLERMKNPIRGLPDEVDPTDVSQAGWAVVFHSQTAQAIRDAVQPLIDHRRAQVPADRCKVLEYCSGQGMQEFLKAYGVYPGSVAPGSVPYYVLLVGDPELIPFQFQFLLDIEYAVGRICFDTADQYRQYADSVVEYEKAEQVAAGREIVYWGPRHDPSTTLSADYLISPLYDGVQEAADRDARGESVATRNGFGSRCFAADQATRDALLRILRGTSEAATPAMLFTASHGLGWLAEQVGHDRQRGENGALFCQDWPGEGPVSMEHYVTGRDIGDDAQLHGLVAFMFACFGAGTPEFNHYLKQRDHQQRIAERPFVAALPQRFLSHPNGGALAVLGHVDMAWSYSFKPPKIGQQLQPFRNLIGRILSGQPVGHSTKDFSERYAALSAELLSTLDSNGSAVSDARLARMWIERNDAQNYILLGDPAARIRVADLQSPGSLGAKAGEARPPAARVTTAAPARSLAAPPSGSAAVKPQLAPAQPAGGGRPTGTLPAPSSGDPTRPPAVSQRREGAVASQSETAGAGGESQAFMAAPSPDSFPKSSLPAVDPSRRFRGILREVRAEAQAIHRSLDCLASACDPEQAEGGLGEFSPAHREADRVRDRNSPRIARLLRAARQLLEENPAIYDWCSDEISQLESHWDRCLANWPSDETDAARIVAVAVNSRDALRELIFVCGRLTIPARVQQHLNTLRIGEGLVFAENFQDELQTPEDCRRLLRYMADHPYVVSGVIDCQKGTIFRASSRGVRRLASYIGLATLVILGYAAIFLATWIPAEQWAPAGRFSELAAAYSCLMAGAVVHLLVGGVKQARQDAADGIVAVKDWLLWVHVREASLALSIIYLWIGLVGLVFLVEPPLSWATAFFVGYSIDSFVDLFMDRFATQVETWRKTATETL